MVKTFENVIGACNSDCIYKIIKNTNKLSCLESILLIPGSNAPGIDFANVTIK